MIDNLVLAALCERCSCKAFAPEQPDEPTLRTIAMAAAQSPSATNKQPWRIIVLRDPALLGRIREQTIRAMAADPAYKGFYDLVTATGMDLFYGAPCMLVLAIDKQNPYAAYDCGIAAQSVCLAAQSLGVASHIIAIDELAFAGEDGAQLRDELGFPEGYGFGLSVLLGKAAAQGTPHVPDPDRISFIG